MGVRQGAIISYNKQHIVDIINQKVAKIIYHFCFGEMQRLFGT